MLAGVREAAAAVCTSTATSGCNCPLGMGNTLVTETATNSLGAVSTGTGILGDCDSLLQGYYIAAGATTASLCPAGSYCPGSASSASMPLVTNGVGTPGGATACTTGFGIGGVTAISAATGCNSIAPGYYIAASATTPSAPTACPAGSYCSGTANGALTNNVAIAAANTISGTPTSATVAQGTTACPTGTTNALTAGSSVGALAVDATVCDDLAPGYAILSAIAAQSTAGAITALTTGITPCAAGYYCPGKALGVNAITAGTTGSTFTWIAVAAITGGNAATGSPQACTAGFGYGVASATYVSANTGCNAIAPGYSLAAAGTTPAACPAGSYCAGFSTASGMTITGNSVTVGPTAATGATACAVTGATSAAGATAASGCNLVGAGYYIDPSGLNTPVACSVGEYCPGNGGLYLNAAGTATATASVVVGTAGGDYNCPAGSVAPGTAPSTTNSALNDCNLLPNFYIPTGTGAALYVPVSCPAGSHCPGGTAIGTAGGSFACPANSTIPACTVAAVTAPSVTVAAAAAPAVTVAAAAAPAVTVAAGAAPVVNVTVAAAPIVSAAPRAAAHAAVLALTAMAALVAF